MDGERERFLTPPTIRDGTTDDDGSEGWMDGEALVRSRQLELT